MDGLTIQEAAATTGWSPRMLRYVEDLGLVAAERSKSGYRLYGPQQLQRLRNEPELRTAIDGWLAASAVRPREVAPSDWLRFEQDKHSKLLADITRPIQESA